MATAGRGVNSDQRHRPSAPARRLHIGVEDQRVSLRQKAAAALPWPAT